MRIDEREDTNADIYFLVQMYRSLEKEMVALHAMWPLADGLNEPVSEGFISAIANPDSMVLVGSIDDYPFGFLVAHVERLLAQSDLETIGSIQLIYVEDDAREVAVAEAMRELALARFRERGITKFDAHVLPGHRLAKNFFEAGGFSARSIIMHHDDHRKR
jgi:ribosomal protein S18 acetylase RimI-like enzyme